MRDFDRTVMAGFALALTAVCGAGCATIGGGEQLSEDEVILEPLETEMLLPTAESLRFDDIPVPAALVLDRKSSFAFENDQMRVAFLVYEGRAELAEVVQFFLNKLPGDGWQLGNVFEHDQTTLMFTETTRGEQLAVTVTPGMRDVTVGIRLTPAGPNRMAGPPISVQ